MSPRRQARSVETNGNILCEENIKEFYKQNFPKEIRMGKSKVFTRRGRYHLSFQPYV